MTLFEAAVESIAALDSALLWRIGVLVAFAFFAGFVDAVVGGGGLVQIPALFTVYPQATPAQVFGTNKVAAIAGTSAAAWRYARSVSFYWSALGPAVFGALVCSFAGAAVVSWLPVQAIRPLVLTLLIVVALYTFAKKDLGTVHGARLPKRTEFWLGLGVGSVLGFYDGFFGPGTGAFLIFLFVRLFRHDFLHASAHAKVVNVATNFAALAFFVPTGAVLWGSALAMAGANVVGAVVGSRVAIARGAAFVRKVFLVVVTLIIVRFAYDTWRLMM